MPEISFYHLQKQNVADALAQLLGKAYGGGHKAVVRLSNKMLMEQLDKALWDTPIDGFLPHATKKDKQADLQPIYLTLEQDNPANAKLLFVVNDAEFAGFEGYERLLYVFDGASELNVEHARVQWKSLKDQGLEPKYWQQGDNGGWQLKGAWYFTCPSGAHVLKHARITVFRINS